MRVLVWNCHCATADSPLWAHVAELGPDLALLQEVGGIPPEFTTGYHIVSPRPISRGGSPQPFRTVIVSRQHEPIPGRLAAGDARGDRVLRRFDGNLPFVEVPFPGFSLRVVNVYNPAWRIPKQWIEGHDWTDVKLTMHPDLWVGDLLWKALSAQDLGASPWIVGGDFNLSETFDEGAGGPRGNREYLDRMEALGFTECLRAFAGRLTPTFRNLRDGEVEHQIDHLFVTAELAGRLVDCRVGDPDVVFGGNLSDHLPIIADFRSGGPTSP